MEVTLVMFKADGQRREFPLRKPVTILGRKRTCDLRIPIASVSREHCQVEVNGKGVILRDLGSSNGTAVNDQRIKQTTLKPGDKVSIGPVHFLVLVDGEPSEIDPVPTVLSPQSVEPEESAELAVDAADEPSPAAVAVDDDDEQDQMELDGLEPDAEPAVAMAGDDEDEGIDFDDLGSEPEPAVAVADEEDDAEEGQAAAVAISGDDADDADEELDLGIEMVDEAPQEVSEEEEDAAIDFMAEEEEQPLASLGDDAAEESSIRLAEDSGEISDAAPAPQSTPAPALSAADDDEDDPFADLALDALAAPDDQDDDALAELAEAFPEDEEEER